MSITTLSQVGGHTKLFQCAALTIVMKSTGESFPACSCGEDV